MDALKWLDNLPRFSRVEYNLYRTQLLLSTLVPEYRELDIFFITGSKGKGTVASTLASIFARAGIKAGCFTSPHLVSVSERISYNGQDIEEQRLAEIVASIRRNLPPLESRHGGWIYTEILLAAALVWFCQQGAQTVVVEAGLGGRLDPGNVFRRPRATCITAVSLEHRQVLGSSLEDIAAEKAGVIKPSTPMITGATGPALDVVAKRAQLFAAPLKVYGRDFAWQEQQLLIDGISVPAGQGYATPAHWVNGALATAMALEHPSVNVDSVAAGVDIASPPGRFEVFSGSPTVVVDVAHTPEAIANLIAGIEKAFTGQPVTFVAGFLQDKAVQHMLDSMIQVGRVYWAPVADQRSCLDIGDVPEVTKFTSLTSALEQARAQAELVCVTGSFAAVRQARQTLSLGR